MVNAGPNPVNLDNKIQNSYGHPKPEKIRREAVQEFIKHIFGAGDEGGDIAIHDCLDIQEVAIIESQVLWRRLIRGEYIRVLEFDIVEINLRSQKQIGDFDHVDDDSIQPLFEELSVVP